MNKLLVHICWLLVSAFAFSQEDNAARIEWEKIRENHEFKKERNYRGPNPDNYTYPSDLKDRNSGSSNGQTNPYQGIPYSEEDIRGGRGSKGTIKADPEIEQAKPILPRDFKPPRLPSWDVGIFNGTFWLYLGIFVLLVIVAYLIYNYLKNRTPKLSPLPLEVLAEDMNPEMISKSELELRLEEALNRGDYKECVRIYFLFAMKKLIELRWIFWKKEKTNTHYIIELSGKPIQTDFEKLVAIYDLVWYGDYQLDEAGYNQLIGQIQSAYQSIDQVK